MWGKKKWEDKDYSRIMFNDFHLLQLNFCGLLYLVLLALQY